MNKYFILTQIKVKWKIKEATRNFKCGPFISSLFLPLTFFMWFGMILIFVIVIEILLKNQFSSAVRHDFKRIKTDIRICKAFEGSTERIDQIELLAIRISGQKKLSYMKHTYKTKFEREEERERERGEKICMCIYINQLRIPLDSQATNQQPLKWEFLRRPTDLDFPVSDWIKRRDIMDVIRHVLVALFH